MNQKGTGLIIKNRDGSLFFLQQKTEEYPIEKWRLAYSVWGGRIESFDKSELDGLKREISEEIEDAEIILNSDLKFLGKFTIESDNKYQISIFEVILSDNDFQGLAKSKIYEGYGKILKKEDISNIKWIWNLEKIMKNLI